MRQARPGSRWDTARVRARSRYGEWMSSPRWWAKREAWVAEHQARYGRLPRCAGCDAPWRPRAGDLHHLTYDRLGSERFEDLLAMCRDCHEAVHRLLDTSRGWRRLDRRAATARVVASLRQANGLPPIGGSDA